MRCPDCGRELTCAPCEQRKAEQKKKARAKENRRGWLYAGLATLLVPGFICLVVVMLDGVFAR